MIDIKQYLPYCVFQEATIKSVDENEFTNGKYRVNSLTYNLIHKYAYDDNNEDYTIIPHMRKINSLTEDEARELFYMTHFKSDYPEAVINGISFHEGMIGITVISKYASEPMDGFIYWNSLSPVQFHYLTSIGIAWWATEDMWESGALIEIND